MSAGRETPVYTTMSMGCPRSCGFCASNESNTPSTRTNLGRHDQNERKEDQPSDEVRVDNLENKKKGAFLEITRTTFDTLDKSKQRPLFVKRNDEKTAVAPHVNKLARGNGRSTFENGLDDSPSWSPYWWSFEGGWEEGVGHACDVCDCITSPRLIQCFGRGLSEENMPGMLEDECTESDGDIGAVCGEGENPDPARNKYYGFNAVDYANNDIVHVTRRMGRVWHRDMEKLALYFNLIESLEAGWVSSLFLRTSAVLVRGTMAHTDLVVRREGAPSC
jgi:hypothetical protein